MKEKIYLFPGFMCDHRLWYKIYPLLDEYELIHVPIPLSESFDEINETIDKVFKEEKVNLLGFSLGGYVSSYYTIKNPHRVNKVFMLSSTAGASNEADVIKRKKKLKTVLDNGFEELGYKKSVSLFEKQNQNDENSIKIVQDMFNELGSDNFITHLKATFNRKNLINEITNLNIPFHFFHSTKDRLLNHDFINELKKRDLDHIKISSRKGTSHNISLEDHILLTKKIKEWMEI